MHESYEGIVMAENDKMLNFDEFAEKVFKNINNYMDPSEKYVFKMYDRTNCNDIVFRSLVCIRSENDNIYSPTVYLEGYYMTYKNLFNLKLDNVDAFDSVMVQLAARIRDSFENPAMKSLSDGELVSILDYDSVKDNLYLKICNNKMNEKFLDNVPHYNFGDISAYTCVNMGKTSEYLVTCTVLEGFLKQWQVTSEKVFKDAYDNDLKFHKPVIVSLENYMKNELVCLNDEEMKSCKDMILTNNTNSGAAAVFQSGELLEKAAKIRESDLWLLPTSIDEIAIIPFSDVPDKNYLDMTCILVNNNALYVDKEKELVNHLLVYKKDSKVIVNPISKETVFDFNKPIFPFLDVDTDKEAEKSQDESVVNKNASR